MRKNDGERERERAKESKGAAMKSFIRKPRIDLSISFFGNPRWISVDVSRKNPIFRCTFQIWANSGKGFQIGACGFFDIYLAESEITKLSLEKQSFAAMEEPLGILRVHVKRGINLAIRDATTSDPYAVVTLGHQKLKTRVINNNCNPVWNEQLTLSIKDVNDPIRLTVFDKDRFSGDDKMGDAEIDMRPFLEAHQMELDFQKLPNGCAIKRIRPGRTNCLVEESSITWSNGKIKQDMILRLKNVECGEVEIMLEWTDGPGCKGLGREGSKKTPWMPTKRLG